MNNALVLNCEYTSKTFVNLIISSTSGQYPIYETVTGSFLWKYKEYAVHSCSNCFAKRSNWHVTMRSYHSSCN